MPISIQDNISKISDFFSNNLLLNKIFNNIFIVAFFMVTIILIIVHFNYSTCDDEINLVKIFIWSFLTNIIFLICHNKSIKQHYKNTEKVAKGIEFSTMMDNNINNLINGQGENEKKIEPDIINFLDRD